MRHLVASITLAAAGVLGLSTFPASQAQASDVRIFVDLGDILFSAGRPYHRHTREPLHVVHHRYGPRYYHHAPRFHGPPRHVVHHHYAPPRRVVHHYYAPPPRHYRSVRHHPGRGHGAPGHRYDDRARGHRDHRGRGHRGGHR